MSKGTPAPHTVYDAVTGKTKTRHFDPEEARLHRAILEHHEKVMAEREARERDHKLAREGDPAALARIVTGWPAGAG